MQGQVRLHVDPVPVPLRLASAAVTEDAGAPDRIKERTREWGRDGLAQRFAVAWIAYLRWIPTWLQVTRTTGLDGLPAVYLDVLSGNVDPARGHVLCPHVLPRRSLF